ncbi:MAG: DinB family protein [Candidatus Dormibacteraceae bacterium]
MIKREDVIAAMGAIPERLTDLAGGMPEPSLSYRHGPAFLTVGEVVGHLAAAGAEVDRLLRRVYLEGDLQINLREAIEPSLSRSEEDSFGALLRYYARNRRSTVDLLRGLKGSEWKQLLQDSASGEVELIDFCQMVVRHEMGHLVQVRTLSTLLPVISDEVMAR